MTRTTTGKPVSWYIRNAKAVPLALAICMLAACGKKAETDAAGSASSQSAQSEMPAPPLPGGDSSGTLLTPPPGQGSSSSSSSYSSSTPPTGASGPAPTSQIESPAQPARPAHTRLAAA